MRDILLVILVTGSLPYILRHAYIGIYVWSWLSYMNPQRLTWGFAMFLPFAQVVAITLLASLFFSKDKKIIPKEKVMIVWLIYIVWMLVTTIFALQPEAAWMNFSKIMKIQLMTFLTMLVITDQRRIDILLWVIVLSIGFYSFKGGIFTLLTGGEHRVWGPLKTDIQENNALALASLVIVPLAYYLYKFVEKPILKWGLLVFIFFTVISVFGSQSRGALLAILSVGGFFWLKSKGKVMSGMIIVILAIIALSVMPSTWYERMETIRTYEQDASAMSRINSWTYNFNLANDRFLGGGLKSESKETFMMYAPNPDDVHSAHSIYFGVLGDHGWPGFFLFILILFMTWRGLGAVIRETAGSADVLDSKRNLLARMIQVSLIAYMSGGAFLSLAYFDLPWHMIAIAILIKDQLRRDREATDPRLVEQDTTRNMPSRARQHALSRVG